MEEGGYGCSEGRWASLKSMWGAVRERGVHLLSLPPALPARLWGVASFSEKCLEADMKEIVCPMGRQPHTIAMKTPGQSNCFPDPASARAGTRVGINPETCRKMEPTQGRPSGAACQVISACLIF